MKNYADVAVCKKCKKEFHPRSNYAFYCDNCSTYKCEFCGESFYRRPRYNYTPRFCSPECAMKWQKSPQGRLHHSKQKLKERGNGKTLVCATCGKIFYRQGARVNFKNHYCSFECRRLSQELICPICGNKFNRPPSDIKVAFINYCSDKCRDIGTIKRRANGELFVPDTKPERIGRTILENIGIKFCEQKVIGFYLVDVFIQPNIVIQWDGDFWHGNPKKFFKLTPVQKKNVQRDKRCNTYLINRNYKVLRFWESDLCSQPSWVSSKIVKVLESSYRT